VQINLENYYSKCAMNIGFFFVNINCQTKINHFDEPKERPEELAKEIALQTCPLKKRTISSIRFSQILKSNPKR